MKHKVFYLCLMLVIINFIYPAAIDREQESPLFAHGKGIYYYSYYCAPDIEELLKNRADPNTVNRYGTSILNIAVETGNLKAFKALLKAGADLRLNPDLIVTIAKIHQKFYNKNHAKIVNFLLETGIDINFLESNFHEPALFYAIRKNNLRLVYILLSKPGIDKNFISQAGFSAIKLANRYHNPEMLNMLNRFGIK